VNSEIRVTAEQLWQRARRSRPTAQLLTEVFDEKALGRILLLHRGELFPRLNAQVNSSVSFLFGTSAFILSSHPGTRIVESLRGLAQKQRKHSYQAPRQERASDLVRQIDEVTRQTLIDNVALEALKLVQRSPALRNLVTQDNPISREDLKSAAGDYSCLETEPLKMAGLKLVQRFLGGKRSRRALHQIAIEVDTLADFVDLETFRLQLFLANLAHYRRIIRSLRIRERSWKESILELHRNHFLEHVGPLYLWCTRCPESGVLASVRTTQLLRPLRCPRCGQSAYSSTSLFPANELDLAIKVSDGMLGAAVGWQLTSRRISFQHSLKVGGTEFDFLVSQGQRYSLIECKMNHIFKTPARLAAALKDNLAQLKAHTLVAQSQRIALASAICVVNHPRAQLASLQRLIDPPQESTVPMQLLSYQDFIPWLKKLRPSQRKGRAFISGQ
jgi:hypothetical protein